MLKVIDKANGYIFGETEQRSMYNLMSTAYGAEFEYFKTADVRERYMSEDKEAQEKVVNTSWDTLGDTGWETQCGIDYSQSVFLELWEK